jgi:hypothetical protein
LFRDHVTDRYRQNDRTNTFFFKSGVIPQRVCSIIKDPTIRATVEHYILSGSNFIDYEISNPAAMSFCWQPMKIAQVRLTNDIALALESAGPTVKSISFRHMVLTEPEIQRLMKIAKNNVNIEEMKIETNNWISSAVIDTEMLALLNIQLGKNKLAKQKQAVLNKDPSTKSYENVMHAFTAQTDALEQFIQEQKIECKHFATHKTNISTLIKTLEALTAQQPRMKHGSNLFSKYTRYNVLDDFLNLFKEIKEQKHIFTKSKVKMLALITQMFRKYNTDSSLLDSNLSRIIFNLTQPKENKEQPANIPQISLPYQR